MMTMTRRFSPGGWLRRQRVRLAVRPTGAGWSVLALVSVLLLMAINEANNLLYALAFLLLSVWLVGAVQAWHNLAGLELRALEAAPVAVGEIGPLRVQLDGGHRERHALTLQVLAATDATDPTRPSSEPLQLALLKASPAPVDLHWRAARRGWQTLDAVQVRSSYPLGLAEAQHRLTVSIRRLVWPQPAPSDGAIRSATSRQADEATQFTGLSPWRAGDSPRRLAWKAMARAGTPMVKRFDGADGQHAVSIDWRDTEGDTEHRLAVLARRVLDAEHGSLAWQLVMPGHSLLPQGPGPVALRRALAALALHDLDRAPETGQ